MATDGQDATGGTGLAPRAADGAAQAGGSAGGGLRQRGQAGGRRAGAAIARGDVARLARRRLRTGQPHAWPSRRACGGAAGLPAGHPRRRARAAPPAGGARAGAALVPPSLPARGPHAGGPRHAIRLPRRPRLPHRAGDRRQRRMGMGVRLRQRARRPARHARTCGHAGAAAPGLPPLHAQQGRLLRTAIAGAAGLCLAAGLVAARQRAERRRLRGAGGRRAASRLPRGDAGRGDARSGLRVARTGTTAATAPAGCTAGRWPRRSRRTSTPASRWYLAGCSRWRAWNRNNARVSPRGAASPVSGTLRVGSGSCAAAGRCPSSPRGSR